MSAIHANELFRGFTGDERAALESRLRLRRFAAGGIVLQQGQYSAELHIIRSGEVRVHTCDSLGQVGELAHIGPGQFVGEMSLLTGQPHSATVTAVKPSESLVLGRDDFLALLGTSPHLAHNLARVLSERLMHANRNRSPVTRTTITAIACPALPACGPALALNLAVSLALHTRRRTLLVVDNATIGRQLEQLRATVLPSLAEITAEPRAVSAHRHALPGHPALPGVSICTFGPPDAHTDALKLLDGCYGHIVLATSDVGDMGWSGGAHHALLIASAAGAGMSTLATTLRDVTRFGSRVALIAADLSVTPSVGQLGSLGARWGAPVLRGLPIDLAALSEESLPPLVRRERRGQTAMAIGWLARHLAECKVGLVLGAGSARGFAHLGVLQVFEREQIPIDVITGTSIGAIVAGAWVAGIGADRIARTFQGVGKRLLPPTVPYTSLFSNRNVRAAIVQMVGETGIHDLPIPYAAVAVDLYTRSRVVLHQGPLWKAMLASAAIPGIYPPVAHDGYLLIDGAVRDPLPTGVAADLGAERVIGIRLSPTLGGNVEPSTQAAPRGASLFDVVLTMLDTMQESIEGHGSQEAAMVIHPAVGKVTLRQFGAGSTLIDSGIRATEAALPALRLLLPWLDNSRPPTFT